MWAALQSQLLLSVLKILSGCRQSQHNENKKGFVKLLTVIFEGVVRGEILKNLAEKQHLLIRLGGGLGHGLLIKISSRDMYKYRKCTNYL